VNTNVLKFALPPKEVCDIAQNVDNIFYTVEIWCAEQKQSITGTMAKTKFNTNFVAQAVNIMFPTHKKRNMQT
jgi:hypothetical protein